MDEYELAPDAEEDLLDIALYGLENFGLAQTKQYHEGLVFRFQEVANNPLQYQAVDHIDRDIGVVSIAHTLSTTVSKGIESPSCESLGDSA